MLLNTLHRIVLPLTIGRSVELSSTLLGIASRSLRSLYLRDKLADDLRVEKGVRELFESFDVHYKLINRLLRGPFILWSQHARLLDQVVDLALLDEGFDLLAESVVSSIHVVFQALNPIE